MFYFLFTFLFTCHSLTPLIEQENEPMKAREILLKNIPLGTSLVIARNTMEKNSFSCSLFYSNRFLNLENIDYLYCDRFDQKTFLLYRRWQIAIILKHNLVFDIKVATGLVGP